jgi:hypothetical protein
MNKVLQIFRTVPESRGAPFLAPSITNIWPSQKGAEDSGKDIIHDQC